MDRNRADRVLHCDPRGGRIAARYPLVTAVVAAAIGLVAALTLALTNFELFTLMVAAYGNRYQLCHRHRPGASTLHARHRGLCRGGRRLADHSPIGAPTSHVLRDRRSAVVALPLLLSAALSTIGSKPYWERRGGSSSLFFSSCWRISPIRRAFAACSLLSGSRQSYP